MARVRLGNLAVSPQRQPPPWRDPRACHRAAGPAADGLIEGGMPVARVRKLAQATAFLGPTACLAAAAVCDDGPVTVGETPMPSAPASSQGCTPLVL